MRKWQVQVDELLAKYESATSRRYAASLAAFRLWYSQKYRDELDAALISEDIVRDYRSYLTGSGNYRASTVNAYLAPIRVIARTNGRVLKVRGLRQEQRPMEMLDIDDLDRLINVVDGPHWSDKRDVALIFLMARAGLRVSETLALRLGDVEITLDWGSLLLKRAKGMRERRCSLPMEARAALQTYMDVRPLHNGDVLFLSRTCRPLDPRDVQRIVAEAARIAGIEFRVTPNALRRSFAARFLAENEGDMTRLATILGYANTSSLWRCLPSREGSLQSTAEPQDSASSLGSCSRQVDDPAFGGVTAP